MKGYRSRSFPLTLPQRNINLSDNILHQQLTSLEEYYNDCLEGILYTRAGLLSQRKGTFQKSDNTDHGVLWAYFPCLGREARRGEARYGVRKRGYKEMVGGPDGHRCSVITAGSAQTSQPTLPVGQRICLDLPTHLVYIRAQLHLLHWLYFGFPQNCVHFLSGGISIGECGCSPMALWTFMKVNVSINCWS